MKKVCVRVNSSSIHSFLLLFFSLFSIFKLVYRIV